jgi:hypothetical protein
VENGGMSTEPTVHCPVQNPLQDHTPMMQHNAFMRR